MLRGYETFDAARPTLANSARAPDMTAP